MSGKVSDQQYTIEVKGNDVFFILHCDTPEQAEETAKEIEKGWNLALKYLDGPPAEAM